MTISCLDTVPVVGYSYSSIINTLNAGAVWRKKGPAKIPVAVAVAFLAFTAELRADPNQKLTDSTTALHRAYCAFWLANGGFAGEAR